MQEEAPVLRSTWPHEPEPPWLDAFPVALTATHCSPTEPGAPPHEVGVVARLEASPVPLTAMQETTPSQLPEPDASPWRLTARTVAQASSLV